jgi:hypothetical protein
VLKHRIDIGPYAGGWGVRYADVAQGPYFSCELALMVAAIHAKRASAAGLQPKIVVQASDGTVQAEWPLMQSESSKVARISLSGSAPVRD